MVQKLSSLRSRSHLRSSGATDFVHLCSPDIAQLIVNTQGASRCGQNNGTNILWALTGGGGITATVMINNAKQVNVSQIGMPCEWLIEMLSWNSTADDNATFDVKRGRRFQPGLHTGVQPSSATRAERRIEASERPKVGPSRARTRVTRQRRMRQTATKRTAKTT